MLDLIQRGVYLTSLREYPRTLLSDEPTEVGVLPVFDRLLKPAGLPQRLLSPP